MWFLLLTAIFRSLPAQVITRLDGSKIMVSDIDQTVIKLMEAAQVQGVNLAILQQNKIAYVQSYGYKNKPQNSLMDTATIVYAASYSKAVFG
ncbi:MAG: serine hydrolase [Saprospiraceae bacterium]|nr:serine hydrolase [Saprospiraceae bacterium]